ncbi:MAG: hypothetical protein DMG54_01160 [Acidobacteria bacterium]|nr:MAG: hypothetical protein DMG54_01160 [Acidobacteriota bacterium]PYU68109.1 MAG: hypothetical protein DMG52_32440 [Acidobacteriota bacterium]
MLLARRASLVGQFLNDSKFGNRIACFGAAPIQQIGCPDFDTRHRFLDLGQPFGPQVVYELADKSPFLNI